MLNKTASSIEQRNEKKMLIKKKVTKSPIYDASVTVIVYFYMNVGLFTISPLVDLKQYIFLSRRPD